MAVTGVEYASHFLHFIAFAIREIILNFCSLGYVDGE